MRIHLSFGAEMLQDVEKRRAFGATNLAYVGSADNISNTSYVDSEESEEKPEKRATWGNKLEFLMSCISMSVGLGNVWRFPFTAYENGGGAFLIPYIIILFLLGKPLYYLEMIVGQFTSRGSVKVWQMVPALKGVAIGQMFATACIQSYYSSLVGLTMFYMFNSFAAQLPWSKCWSTWTENCIDSSSLNPLHNETKNGSVSSSELYFLKEVIKSKNQIDDGIGLPDLTLTMWLFLAWVSIYIVIVKGVKSSGKFSYFLAMFPYVVLFTLLVRACTLEGSINGIIYFIKPDFKSLMKAKVWKEAASQCFYSLGIGVGAIIMFASYNPFSHNIYRDAMIVTTLDTLTSLLAGCTIFGILGNLAHNIGEPDVSKVISSGGSGLAFISYPEAIAKFQSYSQLFSVIFFFMLFTLGVGSAVGLQSSIITNIMDHLPVGKFKFWQVAGVGCIVGFLLGFIYVTPGGQWMLVLIDNYGGSFLIFALTIIQLLGIIWIYGLDNLCWDVEFMLGKPVSAYWRWSWGFITPVFMITIFVYSMANLENPSFGPLEFPAQYITAGWIIFSLGAVQIFVWFVWVIARKYNGIKFHEYFKLKFQLALGKSFSPSNEWGPKNPVVRADWQKFKMTAVEKRNSLIRTENHSQIQQIFHTFNGKYSNI